MFSIYLEGKKRDGCAMAKWFRPFSLLAAALIKQPEGKGQTKRPPATQDDSQQLRKYPRIHPRFYSPFWRNKPRLVIQLPKITG